MSAPSKALAMQPPTLLAAQLPRATPAASHLPAPTLRDWRVARPPALLILAPGRSVLHPVRFPHPRPTPFAQKPARLTMPALLRSSRVKEERWSPPWPRGGKKDYQPPLIILTDLTLVISLFSLVRTLQHNAGCSATRTHRAHNGTYSTAQPP